MLNFKPDKLGAHLLMLRWAVLGALVLGLGRSQAANGSNASLCIRQFIKPVAGSHRR